MARVLMAKTVVLVSEIKSIDNSTLDYWPAEVRYTTHRGECGWVYADAIAPEIFREWQP